MFCLGPFSLVTTNYLSSYGEIGQAIIFQTLCKLFPPGSLEPSKTHPLSPMDFIHYVLVPQVGLMLIQEDLHLSSEEALKTMRESRRYGVAMFPHESDFDKIDAADEVTIEQARKRRRELELEQPGEIEVFESERREGKQGFGEEKGKKVERMDKSRRHPKRHRQTLDSDLEDFQDIAPPKAKERSRPKRKSPIFIDCTSTDGEGSERSEQSPQLKYNSKALPGSSAEASSLAFNPEQSDPVSPSPSIISISSSTSENM